MENKINKTVKNVVEGSIIFGAGNLALGQMGQGQIANQLAPGEAMLGTVATAGIGLGILDMINQETKKNKKYRSL